MGSNAFFIVRLILLLILFFQYPFSLLIGFPFPWWTYALGGGIFFLSCILSCFRGLPRKRLSALDFGIEQLRLCLVSLPVGFLFSGLFVIFYQPFDWSILLTQVIIFFGYEAFIFLLGVSTVYIFSLQLGVKWRLIGILGAWVPILNLCILAKLISICTREVRFECDRELLEQTREESRLCATKYPILLVHGLLFRDWKLINYWGRIPAALKRNGATVYYGNQQSATSIAKSGIELSRRIIEICETTGCEKVNIIAHSKGGLDARYAITHTEAGKYVASLTTVSSPHRGVAFAVPTLKRIPHAIQNWIGNRYNSALMLLGDTAPDLMLAIRAMTVPACKKFNRETPDRPGVLYMSVGSKLQHPLSAQFPLNLSAILVRHFDGASDGMVPVSSMKWGSLFIIPECRSFRGISHADMIDLNRSNLKGFNVREFYVWLVKYLKDAGL